MKDDESRQDDWYLLMSYESTVCEADRHAIHVVEEFDLYVGENEAETRAQVARLLLSTGLTYLEDADIRPVEQCGACLADFDTREPHVAVCLQRYRATEPTRQYCEHVSRCCPHCVSSGHPAYRRLLDEWTRLDTSDQGRHQGRGKETETSGSAWRPGRAVVRPPGLQRSRPLPTPNPAATQCGAPPALALHRTASRRQFPAISLTFWVGWGGTYVSLARGSSVGLPYAWGRFLHPVDLTGGDTSLPRQ